MPADIATALEAGNASSAQTSAAQQAIAALQSNTQQGEAAYSQDANLGIAQYDQKASAANTSLGQQAQNALTATGGAYGQAVNYLQPFASNGIAASNQLMSLLGIGSGGSAGMESALANTPGYQFTLNQGLQAQQNSATARGLGVSGAAMKAGTNYATGLADSTYQNQVQNALTAAGQGVSAAGQQSNDAMNFGTQQANIYGSLGTGLSNNYLAAGSNTSSLLNNLGAGYLGADQTLGQNVGNQYTNIGNAQAGADMATAQALQNTEAELISAAGTMKGGGG